MALDFTKPVQTRNGRKVRILCTDRKDVTGKYSVCGLVLNENGLESFCTWRLDGGIGACDGPNPIDIIQAPIRHPHADVIIAWAEGKTIQVYSRAEDEWHDLPALTGPAFHPDIKYRIKP